MKTTILKLIARIENSVSADVSLKDVRVLAHSHDPEAIDALAGLLDDEGRVGREAARALTRYGRLAEPTLRRCVRSHNPVVVTHAQRLLAALGESPVAEVVETDAVEVTHGAHDDAWAPDDACGEVELPPPVDATNDNADEPPTDFAVLTDPEIARSIAATLYRRGVARQDVDDGVAEVQTRVLELLRVGPTPGGAFSEWRALANRVAASLAIDVARQRKARARYEGDLCEDPDAYATEEQPYWDPVDAKRLLEVYGAMLEAGELPALTGDIIGRKAAGATDAEIGEDLGLTALAVRKRRGIVRGRFVWRLTELGMGELVPRRARQEKDGEAAVTDDLPESLPRSRRG